MRLQAERAPDAPDRRARHPAGLGHAALAPVSGTLGPLAERALDQLGDLLVADPARGSRARFIQQAIRAFAGKPFAPLADRVLAGAQFRRDGGVAPSIGGQKHDAGTQGEPLGCLAAAGPALKLSSFLGAQVKRGGDTVGHRRLPTNPHFATNFRRRTLGDRDRTERAAARHPACRVR